MPEVLPVYEIVNNRAARSRRARGSQEAQSGWLVVALYVKTDVGEPVCMDYRVRAIPDTHKKGEWLEAADQLIRSMSGDHTALPEVAPTPGGVPRYVFEEASQQKLLDGARKALAKPTRVEQGRSVRAAKAFLAAGRRRPGRPPERGLAEQLRILAAVEELYATRQKPGGPTLDDVAKAHAMSRSSLRDLLTWARNDASPRLFTPVRQGQRGGRLTDEARALIAAIEETK